MSNIPNKNFTKQTLDAFEKAALQTEDTVIGYVDPVRRSILKRFPVLFALLVTFGVAATFLGIERLILEYKVLDDSPELILLLGISILVFTGKIYKKLG